MPELAFFAKTHEHENVAKQETEAPSRQKWPKHLLASINQHENRLMMNCFLFIIFFLTIMILAVLRTLVEH
jgi:hypothetical protein